MSASASDRTSCYLQQCLDAPWAGPPSSAPAVPLRTEVERRLYHLLSWVVLDQYEGVCDPNGPSITRMKDAPETTPGMDVLIDDFLCRKFVREIPIVVERVLKFDRLVTQELPNETVQIYLRQAVRCYVLGLQLAAVALARACLEQALRERVPYATEIVKLDALIKAAGQFRTLDVYNLQLATDVKNIGNHVMHKATCTDQEAFDAIVKVRSLVETLYGPASLAILEE